MACATLKRTLDWDTISQRPTKRRRCNPFGAAEKSRSLRASHNTLNGHDGGVFTSHKSVGTPVKERKPSVFDDADIGEISPDEMALRLRDEIKRLHRRKELVCSSFGERMHDSESSGSEMGLESPRRPDSPGSIVRNPEKALFTFKQVQMICEKMLKEKEDDMREKYDVILTNKLAEQYDAFVKFTYDQIQRRYEAAPSYLS